MRRAASVAPRPALPVSLSGRGVVLTPAFKVEVMRKVGRLGRLLRSPGEARVVCAAEKFRRRVRLTVQDRRRVYTGEATAEDLLVAVDEAIEVLRRQLRRERDRRRPAKGRAPRRHPAPAAVREPPADPVAPADVVAQELPAKPMSVEEAALQLGLGPEQFFVFRNANTRDVNVLYRRRDGRLGLIAPGAS